MIPKITSTWQVPEWQIEMARAINTPEALLNTLNLPVNLLPEIKKAHALFPIRIPQPYLRRIEAGNPNDPLLRQVLPLGEELTSPPNYIVDPVGDNDANPQTGILHKYQGRALLTATGACAIHCRYCFRRHFDYRANNPLGDRWAQTLEYLRSESSIYEVILSGGDPLSMSDQKLSSIVRSLESLPNLRYLRIHTRLPVVIPQRITKDFIEILHNTRLKVSLVFHINHPNEIDDQLTTALRRIDSREITLLNQSVLLRGINNDEETLIALSHQLYESGILPYYLHTLDPVKGASHFDLPDERAKDLHTALRHALPGYLVPRLVREIPGQLSKTPL